MSIPYICRRKSKAEAQEPRPSASATHHAREPDPRGKHPILDVGKLAASEGQDRHRYDEEKDIGSLRVDALARSSIIDMTKRQRHVQQTPSNPSAPSRATCRMPPRQGSPESVAHCCCCCRRRCCAMTMRTSKEDGGGGSREHNGGAAGCHKAGRKAQTTDRTVQEYQ
jgi:hypothetical protein